MAKILPGPMVAKASGSVGGTVFSHNRYGMYTRNRTTPVTSTTQDALAAKQRFATQSAAWSSLTAAQRLAWKSFAETHPIIDRLGQSQILQPNAVYVQLNTRITQAGESAITAPPLERDPDGLLTLTQSCDIGAGTFDLTYTATPLAADDMLRIFAAVVSHDGVEYVRNLLRLVGFTAKAQASPFDHQSLVEAKFGTLVVGQIVHVEIDVLDTATGLVSQPFKAKTTVTST
jgi:hypothetical protein